MGQSDLAEFDAADDGRPDAEAAAVAGGDGGARTATADEGFPEAEGRTAVAVMQVDYTIEGYGDDEEAVIHVFGRTPAGEAEHVRVLGFEPYFYAPVDSVDRPPEETQDAVVASHETDGNGEPFESIRGDRLVKIVGRTPRDVGQVRDEFDHYEADIQFPNRFLIDKGIQSGIEVPDRRRSDGRIEVPHEEVEPAEVDADPRVAMIDIEVDDRSGFPEEGEEPIVCLTAHDSYREAYVAWLYEAPDGDGTVESFEAYDRIDGDGDFSVRSFETEDAMLADFLGYIEETDPSVLSGWNFEDFDAPYLLDRLERLDDDTDLDLSVERLSRVGEVWRSDWGGPDIKGRVVFDLLYAYKRTQFTELESYRLEAVGEQELGVGKERYSGDIGDLWEEDPEQLLAYNLRDVELCVEIDRSQEVIAFWDEVRRFVGCLLEDAPTPGDAVDIYVLQKVHGDFALPSKGQQDAEEYEGGAVFDPITGLKEMVTVLDLKCFSGDTELLTPDGPRNIQELSVGDPIYTLDPDSFECTVSSVAETHTYENSFGELHHVRGDTHDLKLTENHRFLTSKERGWQDPGPEDFAFEEFRNLVDSERYGFPTHEPMAGERRETFDLAADLEDAMVVLYADNDLRSFRSQMSDDVQAALDLAHGSSRMAGLQQRVAKYLVPVSVYREHRTTIDEHADDVFLTAGRGHSEIPTTFEMDDWLALLGWFVTEGSVDRERGRFTLHQDDGREREAIRSLLDRMDLEYSVDDRGLNVSNRILANWLAENCGDGAASKRLPEWVFDLDSALLSTLLSTVVRGDGTTTDSGLRKFWTTSEQLKDDVVDLAVRCGEKPTVTNQADGTWYVSIGKRGSFNTANATVESHDGQVHCVTAAENHVVLAGRNGRFQWVGQSLYPMCMVTTNASPETKVDPEAYDGETYRAPNGTHFRKDPDGIIRSMVDELLEEREAKKEARNDHDPGSHDYERFDRQQAAVKVIMNSLYGVLGWNKFRLYDKEMGAAVTATGREVIEFTEQAANDMGHTVAYGDSVTGDRPVVVRDPDGRVRILPIEDLFARAEPPTTDAATATDGGAVSKDRRTLSGWEALSIDDDGSPTWQSITAAIRHETADPVVRLQHKFGESTTTRDHSYVVEDGDELVEATPEEVEEPLRVPGVPDVEGIETVDVYEILRGYEREYEDGRSVGAEAAKRKVKRIHANDEWVWFGHEHHVDQPKTVRVQRHIDLDGPDGRALVRLLAAYVTEGSAPTEETTDSRYGASIAGSRREWLEGLQADYHRLFDGTTASITESDRTDEREVTYETGGGATSTTYEDETLKFQMMNELAAAFFREFAGQTSRGKRIPSLVYHLGDDLQELFLDVLVEGDGSRSFPRYADGYAERNFDLETTSRELAGGLSVLLTQRGEKHSLKYREEKGSYTIRTCDYYRRDRDPVLSDVDHDGRVYDLSVAETENFVDAVGGIVLHNTDSVMIELGSGVDTEDAIEQSFAIEDHINDRYDEFAVEELNAHAHRFQIEFEKLYRRFFQAGKKKRYAGHIVWKEGKEVDDIDITGFEYKRSDIAPITKRVQREVIEMIVRGEALDDVNEYLAAEIEAFQEGEADLEDVGIPGGIGKRLDAYDTDTAQVRGAKYANLLLGTNFDRGSKPKRLYLRKVHPDFFKRVEAEMGLDPAENQLYGEFKRNSDVICFDYADQIPEEFQVDWDKMLEKTLRGPIARVIEALGLSWDEVKSGQEQTGLGEFG